MSDDSREWGHEGDSKRERCEPPFGFDHGSPTEDGAELHRQHLEAKKKPKKKRPLERTLEWARKQGWPVDRAERYIPNAQGRPGGTRRDLFGFADAVALDGLPGVLALQACGTDVALHIKKLAELEHLKAWLAAGNRLWIVGWRQVWVTAVSGKSKRQRWMPRVIEVVPGEIFESGYELVERQEGG